MIESDDDGGATHSLTDYAHSRQVVKDFPRLIAVYTKLLPVLYEFAQYQGVWPVIEITEDSKLLMEMQLKYYRKIYDRKGIIINE